MVVKAQEILQRGREFSRKPWDQRVGKREDQGVRTKGRNHVFPKLLISQPSSFVYLIVCPSEQDGGILSAHLFERLTHNAVAKKRNLDDEDGTKCYWRNCAGGIQFKRFVRTEQLIRSEATRRRQQVTKRVRGPKHGGLARRIRAINGRPTQQPERLLVTGKRNLNYAPVLAWIDIRRDKGKPKLITK